MDDSFIRQSRLRFLRFIHSFIRIESRECFRHLAHLSLERTRTRRTLS